MMKNKADYALALQVVKAVIHQWDPYSLMTGGEFDSEIASVVAQIPRIKSEHDATLALSRVFSSAECAPVGIQLYAALSSNSLVD
jgi:hypothetical protein